MVGLENRSTHLVERVTNDGRDHGSRSVVASESRLAHATAVVDHHRDHIFGVHLVGVSELIQAEGAVAKQCGECGSKEARKESTHTNGQMALWWLLKC